MDEVSYTFQTDMAKYRKLKPSSQAVLLRRKMTMNSSPKTLCKVTSRICSVFRATQSNYPRLMSTTTFISAENCTQCCYQASSCSPERFCVSLNKQNRSAQVFATDSTPAFS